MSGFYATRGSGGGGPTAVVDYAQLSLAHRAFYIFSTWLAERRREFFNFINDMQHAADRALSARLLILNDQKLLDRTSYIAVYRIRLMDQVRQLTLFLNQDLFRARRGLQPVSLPRYPNEDIEIVNRRLLQVRYRNELARRGPGF